MNSPASHPRPEPHRSSRAVARALVAVALAAVLAAYGCNGSEGSEVEDRTVRPETDPPVGQDALAEVAVAGRPAGTMAPGATCVSAGCHTSLVSARFVHGVLRAPGGCRLCHEDDRGGHVFPLVRPGNDGCTVCHGDVTGNRAHQHGAIAVACISCHDPHASEHAALRTAATVADQCAACHPPESHAVPHGPFATGACVACHDPHESDHPSLLRAEGAEQCYLCHEETRTAMLGARRVHAPATMSCLICHTAHGSDHPHALRQPVAQGCFACHTDLEKMLAGVSSPHGALSLRDQCANCHDAHASDHPSLLNAPQEVLCLECHDRPVTANDGRTIPDMAPSIRNRRFLHGPVEAGNCTACHNVHGSSQSRLLRANFTDAFYASFDLKNYALCFECHEPDLVTEERTTELTAFRDGDRNLHYLHVNRQTKGRTCRACHEIHGSDHPSHIAESVPFGDSQWALPIEFRATATGGSCAPGCHKPMSYSRSALPPASGDEP